MPANRPIRYSHVPSPQDQVKKEDQNKQPTKNLPFFFPFFSFFRFVFFLLV